MSSMTAKAMVEWLSEDIKEEHELIVILLKRGKDGALRADVGATMDPDRSRNVMAQIAAMKPASVKFGIQQNLRGN